MKKLLTVLIGFGMFLGFSTQTFAASFQNGSFEDGPDMESVYLPLNAVSYEITAWKVTKGSIDLIEIDWKASEGDRYIYLDGNVDGVIAQTFYTVDGEWYRVQFAMAGNNDSDKIKVLIACAGAEEQSYEFYATGSDGTNMRWTEKTLIFQAHNALTTLSFAGSDNNKAWGAAIDNVRVTNMRPFPEDVMGPMGAVHASKNILWPPNHKKVSVEISGYVQDELSIARDGWDGMGVSEASIFINKKEIILRNGTINDIDEDGSFSIVTKLRAEKGKVYTIELHAWDTNGEPNFNMVDSTEVCVPHDMGKKNKKNKKNKKKNK